MARKPLSIICDAQVQCGTCRDVGPVGALWRESLTRHYDADTRDFACPRGLPWTGTAATQGDDPRLAASTAPGRPDASRAIAYGDWPRAAKAMARLRAAGEIGLGDTAHRLLSRLGGDAMSKLIERLTGRPCGCGSRQRLLNDLFPYAAIDAARDRSEPASPAA